MQCCWVWILFAILLFFAIMWFWTRAAPVPTEYRLVSSLSGSQEVPPVNTSGNGQGTVVVSKDRQYVDYNFVVSDLSAPATVAHFHRGVKGQAGPIVKDLNLEVDENDENRYILRGRWSRRDATQPLTNELINDLVAGRLYANVHTTQYPNGEVRGQVVFA